MSEEIFAEIEKFATISEIQGNRVKVFFNSNPDEAITKIKKALQKKNILFKVTKENDSFYITLFEFIPTKNNYWIPALLFLLTLFTTLMAGAIQQGYIPWQDWKNLLKGIPFSLSLIAILGLHELGHFLISKKNGIPTTLPHFIPFPNPLIGTMGAFIRIKSPISDRKALIQIGAAGPILGFIVAIPITVVGIHLSTIQEAKEGLVSLGSSIIFELITKVVKGGIKEGQVLVLHPMAFAGWLGLFVTSLNLLPIGQLDGGHILYGVFGGKVHKVLSRLFLLVLIPLGFLWNGWWMWALLLVILGPYHPEPLYSEEKLSKSTYAIALIALLIFILTFIPAPIRVVS